MRCAAKNALKQSLSHTRSGIFTALVDPGLLLGHYFFFFGFFIMACFMMDIFCDLLIPYPGIMIAPFLLCYVLKLMRLFFVHQLMKMHPRRAVKVAFEWASLCYPDLVLCLLPCGLEKIRAWDCHRFSLDA